MIILSLLLPAAKSFAIPVSSNVPLDSWVYPAMDKLVALGLIDSALQGSRPWTRLEVARMISEALAQARPEETPPVAFAILARLKNEFQEQLEEMRGGGGGGYFKPLRELRLAYIYQEGIPAVIAGPGVVARQFPLNYNNFGIDYRERQNGQAVAESEARLGKYFLLDVRSMLLADQDDTTVRLLEGKAALELGPVEISAGRQSLWWGQGRHGSLILTNNAQPLDMLRITNPSPILLPWLLKYLGPFRFDVFWSQLEEERVVPEPYFAGLRLNIKPFPWLEIGGSRTVIFGGEGRPGVGFSDFITILGGKNLSGGDDTSDQLAALDARLRLPFLAGAELYGEYGGEDEAGHFLSNLAWLAGLYLPCIEPTCRLSLRAEYADLSHIDANSPAWYRHGAYRSGYTYEGKILGHSAGGAAKDYYGELDAWLGDGLLATAFCDYQERGFDQPVREKHLAPGVRLEWLPRKHLSLFARYAVDRVTDFGFVAGDDRTFHLGMAGIKIGL